MMASYYAQRLALYLALGAAYMMLAWAVHRRARASGLGLLWLACLTLYGYVRFRILCSQPLTCDVVGPGWEFTYFVRDFPPYALMGAVMFGAASLLVIGLRRVRPEKPLRPRDVAVGAFVTLGGWVVSALAIDALRLPAY